MPIGKEGTRNTNMFQIRQKGHIAKDCKEKQIMKKRKVQKESDDEDDKKEESFGDNLK